MELTKQQELNLETAKISWKELQVFFAKGNLLQISAGLDLVKVAAHIASNDLKATEELIANGNIAFATPDWIKTNCHPETQLWAVVVAPYVICQLA